MPATSIKERTSARWYFGLASASLAVAAGSVVEGFDIDEMVGYDLPFDTLGTADLDLAHKVAGTTVAVISAWKMATYVSKLRLENSTERQTRLTREYDALQAHLSGDTLPEKADAVFIPGLAADVIDAYRLFDHIANLVKTGRVSYVIYSDRDWRATAAKAGADPSVAGAQWYRDELIKRGVPEHMLVPAGQEARHTRGQTDELIDTCKAMGIKSVIMASVTYHNARIVSSAVASMAERGHSISMHCLNAPPAVDPKTFEVTKSQGAGKQSLEKEIEADRERGIQYLDNGSPVSDPNKWTRPKGYGAPPEVLKAYLKFRDTNNLQGWEAYLSGLTNKKN